MPGLVPGIHAAPQPEWCRFIRARRHCVPAARSLASGKTGIAARRGVDGRDKPGHDAVGLHDVWHTDRSAVVGMRSDE